MVGSPWLFLKFILPHFRGKIMPIWPPPLVTWPLSGSAPKKSLESWGGAIMAPSHPHKGHMFYEKQIFGFELVRHVIKRGLEHFSRYWHIWVPSGALLLILTLFDKITIHSDTPDHKMTLWGAQIRSGDAVFAKNYGKGVNLSSYHVFSWYDMFCPISGWGAIMAPPHVWDRLKKPTRGRVNHLNTSHMERFWQFFRNKSKTLTATAFFVLQVLPQSKIASDIQIRHQNSISSDVFVLETQKFAFRLILGWGIQIWS